MPLGQAQLPILPELGRLPAPSSQQAPAGQAPGSYRPGTAPAASLLQAGQARGASVQHEVEQRAQQQTHDLFAPPPSPKSARAAAASSSTPRGAERPTVDISADRPAFLGRQSSAGADIGSQRSGVGCDAGDRPAAGVSTERAPVSQQQQEQQWSAEAAAAIAEARAAWCPDLPEPRPSMEGAAAGLVDSGSHDTRGGAKAAEGARPQHNAAAPAASPSQAPSGSASRALQEYDDPALSDSASAVTAELPPTGAASRPQSACKPPSKQPWPGSEASDMQLAEPSRPGDQPTHSSPQAAAAVAAAEARQGRDGGAQSGPLQAEERDQAAVRSAMEPTLLGVQSSSSGPMGCSLTPPGAQCS